jgi:uncharacterized protein
MPFIRILVDGYSLLHNWPDLAPGRPRHCAAARDELVQRLTLYSDAVGMPITIFFDGSGAPVGTPAPHSTHDVEVLYSGPGQTADDLIERVAYRLREYGDVLAVTDDYAERDTVVSMGGMASSCGEFIRSVENALNDLGREIKNYNRRERARYKNKHE